jgi:hypothetical protein
MQAICAKRHDPLTELQRAVFLGLNESQGRGLKTAHVIAVIHFPMKLSGDEDEPVLVCA